MKHEVKRVYIGGTFDIINAGHIRAFKLAKSLGDLLVVGLNTDKLVSRDKNHAPVIPYEQRKEILEGLRYIDKVIPISEEQALPYLVQENIDVFVLTKEWEERHKETAIRYMEGKGGQVVFSPRWEDIICSSDIRRIIKERF